MKNSYYENISFGMGTVIEQKISAQDKEVSEKIFSRASEQIKHLEGLMSYFIPDSIIGRLNSSNSEPVKLDENVYKVLKAACRYYELSHGAFDITVAPLSSMWRNTIANKTITSESTVHNLNYKVSGEGLKIDEFNMTASLKQGQSIDLGGIAKGYTADELIKLYKELRVNSAFINLGGNVKTLGTKLNGDPWMIGLQDPRSKRGDFIAAIECCDMSIVTSGDYEKYFLEDNKRYHHIIDPRTGYPSDSGIISATVVSNSSMEADALSTAVFVSGLDYGMELIYKMNVNGVIITKDKKVYVSKGLSSLFHIQSNNKPYSYYYF